MKGEKIGVAVIGCGQIARSHMDAVKSIHNAEIVAVTDIRKERATEAAEKYGGTVYDTADELLADESVDAVILPLPHQLHCPFAVRAAEAGKHVLVEKPMALNLGEAELMVEAAERNNVVLMVGQSTRFRPEVWEAKRLIDSGQIGTPRQIIHQRAWLVKELSTDWRYSPSQCGGLYVPLFSSHDVDMILWFMREKPIRVFGQLRSFLPFVDAESDGFVSVEFEFGGLASMAFSMNSRIQRHSALVIGDEGTILIDGWRLWLNDEPIDLTGCEGAFVRQTGEFIGAIIEDRRPIASGQEVLSTVAVLDAIKISAKSGTALEI